MRRIKIIFFGSTDDSLLVLRKLHGLAIGNRSLEIACVVTQPPRPNGRKQMITPTPVEIWAKKHHLPLFSFSSNPHKSWMYADENQVIDAIEPFKADLVVSACYGQKIPQKTITDARLGGLNVHPSLLPRWRGADPVPWAILSGDHQAGVTIVTLNEKFDEGHIVAQKKIPMMNSDTSDALRTRLFTLGADLLINAIPDYVYLRLPSPSSSPAISPSPYARRLTRDDGFESWETIQKSFLDPDESVRLERKFRAFAPWPGVWTSVRIRNHELGSMNEKRVKIIACHLDSSSHSAVHPATHHLIIDTVQLEGKNPVSWTQFHNAYLPS